MQMSIKLKQRMKNEQRLNVSAQTSSSLFSRREGKKTALLKKCGVMEALNKHERFILESPIIPP